MARRLIIAALAIAVSASGSAAQFYFLPPVRDALGFSVAGQVVQPVGEFRNQVRVAWGFGATGRWMFTPSRLLGVRSDFSFLNYGNESRRVPFSTTVNRVLVDMRTSNNIALVSIGPELVLGTGPIQPYAHAFIGHSWFYTQSSVNGNHHDDHDIASSTSFLDDGAASGYGGGIRIPVHSRRTRASIDIGGRMTSAGVRTYLLPGDIRDQPDGSMTVSPRTTATDFWQYHIGVTFSSRPRSRR